MVLQSSKHPNLCSTLSTARDTGLQVSKSYYKFTVKGGTAV